MEQSGRRMNLEIAMNLREASRRRSMYPREFVGWIGEKIANSSDGRHELTETSAVHQAQQMLSGWPEPVRNLLLHQAIGVCGNHVGFLERDAFGSNHIQ